MLLGGFKGGGGKKARGGYWKGREKAAWKMGLAVVGGKVGLGGQWGSMDEVTLCPEGKGRG